MEDGLRLTHEGDLAMVVASNRKQFFVRLSAGEEFHSHRGVVQHSDLIGIPWGSEVRSHLGLRYYIVKPTLRDLLLHTKRQSQIIFPKDIGYILLRLSIGPGTSVIEAGTGSGALTTAFAWLVGSQGKVISFDRREDMQNLARSNLRRVGLEDRVDFRLADIEDGFDITDADALFLDLPIPHQYLAQARAALSNGGMFGAIVPTTNQVSDSLMALQQHHFALVDVCEILLRFYKTVPQRVRPVDRMVAHTGYLIFARPIIPQVNDEAEDSGLDFT